MLFVYLFIFILVVLFIMFVLPRFSDIKRMFRRKDDPVLINKLKWGGGYLNESYVSVGRTVETSAKHKVLRAVFAIIVLALALLLALVAYLFVKNGPNVYFDDSVQDRRLGREIYEMFNKDDENEATFSASPTPLN